MPKRLETLKAKLHHGKTTSLRMNGSTEVKHWVDKHDAASLIVDW
jgi:hypothetical protein